MAVKKCPHCSNDDPKLLEYLSGGVWRCEVCSKVFQAGK